MKIFLTAVILLLALGGVGACVHSAVYTSNVEDKYPPVGSMVDVNGKPVHVTRRFDLSTGLLGIGVNDLAEPQRLGRLYADLADQGIAHVRYGSGALMLAWVAAGRLVGYAEPRMSAWDCMAGYCLIEAAGGRVLPFPTGDRLTSPAPVLGAVASEYQRIHDLMRLGDDGYWKKLQVP